MKLRNKVLAGFAATVMALTLMTGAVFASTDVLPFTYGEEAGVATNNDVWVVLFGGTAATPLTDDTAVRDSVASVDVVITGKCSFDAELIANCQSPNWLATNLAGQSVDGETVLNMALSGKDQGWVEVIINLKNKTEGPLEITRLDFKDADGNVVLSHGAASDAPKTGVVSTALFLGLGAAVFGTGAVVLKKKEEK